MFVFSKFVLFFGLFVTTSLFAQSRTLRVECWEHDCLTHGWTATNPANGLSSDFACYRDGCLKSGWIIGGSLGPSNYTQCKEGGCFTEGWFELDRQTQSLQMQVVCGQEQGVQDCLKYGWMSYTPTTSYMTTCLDNDCRQKGWVSRRPSGGYVQAICRGAGCFIDGWNWL